MDPIIFKMRDEILHYFLLVNIGANGNGTQLLVRNSILF
jgi:hypothetical protein